MAAGIYKTVTQQPDMLAAAKAGVISVTEWKQRRIRSIAVYAALAVVTGVKETINENSSR